MYKFFKSDRYVEAIKVMLLRDQGYKCKRILESAVRLLLTETGIAKNHIKSIVRIKIEGRHISDETKGKNKHVGKGMTAI